MFVYSPMLVTDRIRLLARMKGVTLKQMFKACKLNINTLSQMGQNGLASFSLAKIAGYLDCSIDYLLCRTDNPNAHKTHEGNVVAISDDALFAEIVNTYKQLSPLGKAKAYVFIDEVLKLERTGNML